MDSKTIKKEAAALRKAVMPLYKAVKKEAVAGDKIHRRLAAARNKGLVGRRRWEDGDTAYMQAVEDRGDELWCIVDSLELGIDALGAMLGMKPVGETKDRTISECTASLGDLTGAEKALAQAEKARRLIGR